MAARYCAARLNAEKVARAYPSGRKNSQGMLLLPSLSPLSQRHCVARFSHTGGSGQAAFDFGALLAGQVGRMKGRETGKERRT